MRLGGGVGVSVYGDLPAWALGPFPIQKAAPAARVYQALADEQVAGS